LLLGNVFRVGIFIEYRGISDTQESKVITIDAKKGIDGYFTPVG
jgi:hypothetical protein